MSNIINRWLEIRFPNGDHDTITGSNIVAESMTITRSLCDGDFKLGGCIASSFEIQLIGIPPDSIQGKKIQVFAWEQYYANEVICPATTLFPSVNIYPSMHPLRQQGRYFFTGTIDSAKRQQNRQIIQVTAYDDLYTLGNNNAYTWFYNFANYSSTATVRDVVNGLFSSPARLEDLEYINRFKTSNGNASKSLSLSASLVENKYGGSLISSEILRSVCELTNCCGYINEKGEFDVIDYKENSTAVDVPIYEDLQFEEYITQTIDGVVFTYGDNKQAIYGRASTQARPSCYYSDDNVITNCCSDRSIVLSLATSVGTSGRLLHTDYCYRPFTLKMDDNLADGIKLGSKLKVATGLENGDIEYVNSFVMADKMTGIISLKHEYSAAGDKILAGYEKEAIT